MAKMSAASRMKLLGESVLRQSADFMHNSKEIMGSYHVGDALEKHG